MKRIKLMFDYECSPIWWDQEDKVGNIDPNDLPLTKKTKAALNKLANWFDKDLDPGTNYLDLTFRDYELKRLHKIVQKELPDYEVRLHV